MLRLLGLLVATGVVATACGSDGGSVDVVDEVGSTTSSAAAPVDPPPVDPDGPAAELAAARARWAEVGPTAYRMTLRELCFCPETVWTETVIEGSVASHEPGTDDALWDPGARTMEDLFDEIGAAIDAGYATLELELDPDTGALVRYWVDVDEMIADEEYGVEVVSLTTGVDPVGLVEDHPCGWGFGTDLFADHCDDVIEPDEPVAVVAER